MKPPKTRAAITQAPASRAAGRGAPAKATSSANQPSEHHHHGRTDEKKGNHRGVAIRLGALDGRRLQRPVTPQRQAQRRPALPRSQAAQLEEMSNDEWRTARLDDQQEAMRIAEVSGSRSMSDSSSDQQGSSGSGSKSQGELARQTMQFSRVWHRQAAPEEGAETAAAICGRLFAAARSVEGGKGEGIGLIRQRLLAELAAQYQRYATAPPGGGLAAVQQQLVSAAPRPTGAVPATALESSLNCLMPLLLLNLQRYRPPSLLGLAVAKAAVMSAPVESAAAVVAPPASTWRAAS